MKIINILFIEDEMLLRTLFEDAIVGYKDDYAGFDFQPNAVPDLNSAMVYLNEQPAPDVIILDLRLPIGESDGMNEVPEKENGFTILKYVKSESKFKNTPVIVFTNLSDSEIEFESKKLGADEFLVKSKVLPAELLESIIKFAK